MPPRRLQVLEGAPGRLDADGTADLNKELPGAGEFVAPGFEAIHFGAAVIKLAFVGGVFSGVMLLVDLPIAVETHFDDPEEALNVRSGELQNLLTQMGITDPMELFLGGGVDFQATGCELKLTPIFRSLDAARSAAQAIGRAERLVVSWRTDQSGGMKLEDLVQP